MEELPKCKHKARKCGCGICIACPRPSQTVDCTVEHPSTFRSVGRPGNKRRKEEAHQQRELPSRSALPKTNLNLDEQADNALESAIMEVVPDQNEKPLWQRIGSMMGWVVEGAAGGIQRHTRILLRQTAFEFAKHDEGHRDLLAVCKFILDVIWALITALCATAESKELVEKHIASDFWQNLSGKEKEEYFLIDNLEHCAVFAPPPVRDFARTMLLSVLNLPTLNSKLRTKLGNADMDTKSRLAEQAGCSIADEDAFFENHVKVGRRWAKKAKERFESWYNGEESKGVRSYSARITPSRIWAAVNWLKSRVTSTIMAGRVRNSRVGNAIVGQIAFFQRSVPTRDLVALYKEETKADAETIGTNMMRKIVNALTVRTKTMDCVSDAFARAMAHADLLIAIVKRLMHFVEAFKIRTDKQYFDDLGFDFSDLLSHVASVKSSIEFGLLSAHIRAPSEPDFCDCDGVEVHCARAAARLSACSKTHCRSCMTCQMVFAIVPMTLKAINAVLHTLQDENVDDARFKSCHWEGNKEEKTQASSETKITKRASKIVEPENVSILRDAISEAGKDGTTSILMVFKSKAPNSKASHAQIKKAIKKHGIKESRNGGSVQWYLKDAMESEMDASKIGETDAANIQGEGSSKSSIKQTGEVAAEFISMREACRTIEDSLVAFAAHEVQCKVQCASFENTLSNMQDGEVLLTVDYKMKTLPSSYIQTQSAFYGRAGFDLLGAMISFPERTDNNPPKRVCHFLDSVLSTTEHTVSNFLATLPSIIKTVADLYQRKTGHPLKTVYL